MLQKIFDYSNFSHRKGPNGFTLLELLIAISIMSIVTLFLSHFMLNMSRNYENNIQSLDMRESAVFAFNRVNDILNQVGADFPSDYPAIQVTSPQEFRIAVNPRGGRNVFEAHNSSTATKITVDDITLFKDATHILRHRTSPGSNQTVFDTRKVVSFATAQNEITINSQLLPTSGGGDFIYPLQWFKFKLDGEKLLMNEVELADNVESFVIEFYKDFDTKTTDWDEMKFARFFVETKSTRKDRGYTHPEKNDNYRRHSLQRDIQLKNR